MPKDRKFVNPLTQSTETLPSTSTLPATETSTLPSTSTITYTSTSTSTLPQIKHRKRGSQAFEKTHERITLWIDSDLKQRFEALADEQGRAKSTLLDEAISDLLAKFEHSEAAALPDQESKMKGERESMMRRLTLEERLHEENLDHEKRFRTDTQVHHFKKWLRAHDQPQDSDFAQRFLADSRLPQHASRGMYEAKLRTAEYSEEDIHLFQDAWKTMLFFDNVPGV